MVADKNRICVFCDSFILRGEEYSNESGCLHCNHIVSSMKEDGYSDFNEFVRINNIPFEERVIKI